MLVAFSISPTATSEDGSVSEAVAAAVRVVKESGLPWELTSMFTTVEGDCAEVRLCGYETQSSAGCDLCADQPRSGR